jgi:DNA-binding response OmpR family regulator
MQQPATHIKRILHIDDDEEDFLMLQEAIKAVHTEVEVYYLGECPSRFGNPDIPHPDLVFLDINMHGSDGFHWLERIRAKGFTDLPIIMYSTASTAHYITKAYTLGANLFFIKPHTFNELVDSVRHILTLDWKSPGVITNAHFREGKYHPFQMN